MQYLKEVFPEKYEVYNTFLDAFTLKGYNLELQFILIFPVFKTYKLRENEKAKFLARKVRSLQYINFFFFLLLVSPLLLIFFLLY